MAIRVLDLFCGAGGSSTGATSVGCEVVGAVDCWSVALASHALNHPDAEHFCDDISRMDPAALPTHELLLASPPCTGHAHARGSEQEHHKKARAMGWSVVRVAEAHRPWWVIVENVPEMRDWSLYRKWLLALEKLGYRLTETVLNAMDCGVPQDRKRLFVVGTLGRSPVTPRAPMTAWSTAGEYIDLEAGSWRPWRKYVPASVARIKSAQLRHGPVVLVPYYGSASSHAGRSLDRPIGTLTTRDRYVVVRGNVARVLSVEEQLALSGFPPGYELAGTRGDRVAQIGNAVPPPLAAAVVSSVLEASR